MAVLGSMFQPARRPGPAAGEHASHPRVAQLRRPRRVPFWLASALSLGACTLEPADAGSATAAPAEPGTPSAAPTAAATPAPPGAGSSATAGHRLEFRDQEYGCFHGRTSQDSVVVSDTTLAQLRSIVLASRAVGAFDPALLGITNERVRENRETVVETIRRDHSARSARLDRATLLAIRRRLTAENVASVAAWFMHAEDSSTDQVEFEATLPGQPAMVVSSRHLAPLMLPWHVRAGDEEWETYSPELPRALASVLPDSIPSHPLLAGDRFWSQRFWSDERLWRNVIRLQILPTNEP